MDQANKVPSDRLKEAKEVLGVTALAQLKEGQDFAELAYTKVEFGYIYLRGGDYEALFKVITDKKTIYFAAQQGKLIHLDDTFSDQLFQGTIQQMEIMHGAWI